MALTFSQQLREGYRQLVRSLPPEERAVVECAHDGLRSCPHSERGGRLLDLVTAYRAGPRCRWGPVLLDVLAGDLVAVLRLLREEPPFLAEDDLRQHLVAELLWAAARIPLPGSNTAYLKLRLLARAKQRVVRALARERRRQTRQASLEFMQERDEAMAGWERWKSMIPASPILMRASHGI